MRNQLLILALATAGLATAAVATPVTSTEQSEFEQVIQAALAEIMRTGPHEPNWNSTGIDLDALVAASPGGVAANYVMATDRDGERSIVVHPAAKPLDLVPREWSLISQVGGIETGNSAGPVAFEEIEDGFVFLVQGTDRRDGGAFCGDKFQGAQLYTTGKTATTELPPEVIEMLFTSAVELFRDKPICARYTQNGAAIGVRYYLPDGRSLTTMDSYREVITIVRAAPIEALLSGD